MGWVIIERVAQPVFFCEYPSYKRLFSTKYLGYIQNRMKLYVYSLILALLGVVGPVFSEPGALESLAPALASQEPVTVLVKMENRFDLSSLQGLSSERGRRSQQIVEALETHLKTAVEEETPWIKGGEKEGIEEVTPLWLVSALKVRVKPAALEKLIIVKGTRSISLEKAKPIYRLYDDYVSVSSKPTENISLLNEEIGWGVRKVGAPEVWGTGVEGQGVIVAVLDSGVNVNHPDLEGNIWKNPGEIGQDEQGNDRSTNGIDDDQNGYTDDVYGWNFEQNSADISDYMGHGTQSAGIIAGQGKNGFKTGIAPKAKIMTLRSCCMLGGEVAESAIWEATQYAMKQGAQVISMSVSMKHWGKPNYLQWRRASEVLNTAGIVHVNSAGNRGKGNEPYNIGAPGSNPPAWIHPLQTDSSNGGVSSMITVGAVDFEDHIRNYSSTGPVTWEEISGYGDFPFEKGKRKGLMKPEICAPSETPSLSMDGTNYTLSFGGTSSATPHVAGAIALLLSQNPHLTVAQVTEAIQMSAVNVGEEFTNQCGSGRLDVQAAVNYVKEHFK